MQVRSHGPIPGEPATPPSRCPPLKTQPAPRPPRGLQSSSGEGLGAPGALTAAPEGVRSSRGPDAARRACTARQSSRSDEAVPYYACMACAARHGRSEARQMSRYACSATRHAPATRPHPTPDARRRTQSAQKHGRTLKTTATAAGHGRPAEPDPRTPSAARPKKPLMGHGRAGQQRRVDQRRQRHHADLAPHDRDHDPLLIGVGQRPDLLGRFEAALVEHHLGGRDP